MNHKYSRKKINFGFCSGFFFFFVYSTFIKIKPEICVWVPEIKPNPQITKNMCRRIQKLWKYNTGFFVSFILNKYKLYIKSDNIEFWRKRKITAINILTINIENEGSLLLAVITICISYGNVMSLNGDKRPQYNIPNNRLSLIQFQMTSFIIMNVML